MNKQEFVNSVNSYEDWRINFQNRIAFFLMTHLDHYWSVNVMRHDNAFITLKYYGNSKYDMQIETREEKGYIWVNNINTMKDIGFKSEEEFYETFLQRMRELNP